MLICLSYVTFYFFVHSFIFLLVPLIYLRWLELRTEHRFFPRINFVVITSYISIWKSYLCIQQINFPVIIVKYMAEKKECDTANVWVSEAFALVRFFCSTTPLLCYWSWLIKCHDKILHNIHAFGVHCAYFGFMLFPMYEWMNEYIYSIECRMDSNAQEEKAKCTNVGQSRRKKKNCQKL